MLFKVPGRFLCPRPHNMVFDENPHTVKRFLSDKVNKNHCLCQKTRPGDLIVLDPVGKPIKKSILDHFRPSLTIFDHLDHFGLFLNIRDHLRTLWTILDTFFFHLGPFQTFLDTFGQFWSNKDNF